MVYNMHACNVMHHKKKEKERKKDRVRQVREHGISTEGGKCEWHERHGREN